MLYLRYSLEKKKKPLSLSAWPCWWGKWQKWKRNFVIKFPGILKNSGCTGMGQLWKARTPQTRKDLKQILEPVFSSLLFRVPSWGRSFLCLPHVCKCCVQVSYQAKRVNRRGTDIFWSHLCSVFGLISESPHLLPCSYPITKFFSFFFFFLVSLFQLYELGWSLLSSCAAHNFIIYSAFLKIPSQCLSLLMESFWHATDFSLGFILPFPRASSFSSLLVSCDRVSFQLSPD